jgi:hypothetical protein
MQYILHFKPQTFFLLKTTKGVIQVYPVICHAVKHLIYSDERKQLLFLMAISYSHFRKEILNRMTNVVLRVMTLVVLFFMQ